MSAETEIKLVVTDPKAFSKRLRQLSAKPAFPGVAMVHELNILFDTPARDLANRGQLLRIRTETPGKSRAKSHPRVILTLKSPPAGSASEANGRYKVREETELTLSDAAALQKIFESLGLRPWFRYEKLRSTFRLPSRQSWSKGLLIELDEIPIGTFAELEGPGDAIDRAASLLGFTPADYIQKNYFMVYLEWCRAHAIEPSDMLFSAPPR